MKDITTKIEINREELELLFGATVVIEWRLKDFIKKMNPNEEHDIEQIKFNKSQIEKYKALQAKLSEVHKEHFVAKPEPKKKTFYFTFGSDPNFPFYGGWVEIRAIGIQDAIAIFKEHHPNRYENILNCADFYNEEEFKATIMYNNGNRGETCHARYERNKR